MRTTMPALGLALALTLAACGGAEESDAESNTGEPAQTETFEPEESADAQEPEDDAAEGDWTEDLRDAANGKPWAENVTAATETEPGRLEVETDLVDPRGDDGSPEAQTAIEICEVAVSLLEDDGVEKPYVAVMEQDGTHWVLHGHPAYPNGCTEV